MAESPLISCIVPVYNQALYLGETIRSILAQTYRPVEVIVVDDGSTDDAAAVVAGYVDQVRYVWQSNAGPSAARNRGVALSTGAYLAFLDGDDLWLEEKLSRQMAFLQASPEVEMCVSHWLNFWSPELNVPPEGLQDALLMPPQAAYTFSSLLVSRSGFDRVGPLDEHLFRAEDTEWMMRAAHANVKCVALDEVLVRRRCHRTNISRMLVEEHHDILLMLLRSHLDRSRHDESQVSMQVNPSRE